MAAKPQRKALRSCVVCNAAQAAEVALNMYGLAACRDMQHAIAVHLSTGLRATVAPASAAALTHTIAVCSWPDWGTVSASKQMGDLNLAFRVHSGCVRRLSSSAQSPEPRCCLLPAWPTLAKVTHIRAVMVSSKGQAVALGSWLWGPCGPCPGIEVALLG